MGVLAYSVTRIRLIELVHKAIDRSLLVPSSKSLTRNLFILITCLHNPCGPLYNFARFSGKSLSLAGPINTLGSSI